MVPPRRQVEPFLPLHEVGDVHLVAVGKRENLFIEPVCRHAWNGRTNLQPPRRKFLRDRHLGYKAARELVLRTADVVEVRMAVIPLREPGVAVRVAEKQTVAVVVASVPVVVVAGVVARAVEIRPQIAHQRVLVLSVGKGAPAVTVVAVLLAVTKIPERLELVATLPRVGIPVFVAERQ